VLLGAALLYGIRPAPALRQLGDQQLQQIWERPDREPPISEGQKLAYLGIAHGWAGYLYAALAWARPTATAPSASVIERLAQLAALAKNDGRVLRMPVVVPGHATARGMVQWMDGWCHGQAGHVFLHLLAGRVLRAQEEVTVAVRHGEAVFAGYEDFGNLCCGLAGRSYALLALYRETGDTAWLRRARTLSARAGPGSVCDRWPNSLYKGRVEIALLATEIERSQLAAMPLFEDEGWL
jgi:hypothetical protein